ncbi:MAG: hypothetical protein KDA61_14730, partial [Planctomycetales bacterium]|nr:hypothetical protein [Planctomycetales bacterium]
MTRCLAPYLAAMALAVWAPSASAYEHVVAIGDSLLDDSSGSRSPVVAAQLADLLGVPLSNFANSGSTSTAMLEQQQPERAAAAAQPGDLAVVWIGGNDLFWSAPQVTFGNYDFIDTLAANVSSAFEILRQADLEIVAFNLPDFADVPIVQTTVKTLVPFRFLQAAALENFTQAARFWNDRLVQIAAQYDATVVDVFGPLSAAVDRPADFALLGHEPIAGPDEGCQFCIFADSIHPSAFAQGWALNAAVAELNGKAGFEYLEPHSEADLARLAGLIPGDFDENLQVGSLDLATWVASLGSQPLADGLAARAAGDADGDHDADGSDFLFWQRDFTGDAPVAASGVSVPEPLTP